LDSSAERDSGQKSPPPDPNDLESSHLTPREPDPIVGAKLGVDVFVSADSLVIVDKVAGAVDDRVAAIWFHRLRMVRGVTKNQVHLAGIDKRAQTHAVVAVRQSPSSAPS
jgi:hypothetical protein